MAVAFRAITSAGSGSSASSITFPGYASGTTTGDTVFWAISVNPSSGSTAIDTPAAPTGWTLRVGTSIGSIGHKLIVYQKDSYTTGDSSPANLSVQISGVNDTANYATFSVSYSGVTSTGTWSTGTTSSGTSVSVGVSGARSSTVALAIFSSATNATSTASYNERGDYGATAPSLSVHDQANQSGSMSNSFLNSGLGLVGASVVLYGSDSFGAYIGASLSGVTFPLRHAGLGPFISSAGNVYFFGRDSTNTGNCEPHKASDPTSSFTAQTAKTMSSATSTAIEAMSAVQVSNVIHVATQISTGAGYYNSYTMDTDSWSLTTSETAMAANTSGFAPATGNTWCSLGVRSGGNVVFFFSGGVTVMSGTLNTMYYRERTGTNTYGTATIVASGTNNYTGGPLIMGASDRAHLQYKDHTNSDAYHRTLSSANALSTANAFDATSDTTLFIWGPGVSYTSGANTAIRAPYGDSGTTTSVVAFDSADTPTISTQTGVSGATVKATNTQLAHALAVSSTTNHLLYSDATTSDLWRDNDGGTGTWGTDAEEWDAATINAITSNVYTRSQQTYLAMVVDDNATLKYAEIPIYKSIAFEPNRTQRLLALR